MEPKRTKRVNIKPDDSATTYFMIQPNKVGPMTVKVTATSPLANDAVEHILKIEPEGVPQNINKAVFIDLRNATSLEQTVDIEIPNTSVTDSIRIKVTAVGKFCYQSR